mgnify:CR=1 FL=1
MSSSKKLLLVEDNEDFREILSWELESFGYTPWLAGSLNEAKGILREDVPDLILSDYLLDDGFGIHLLEHSLVKQNAIPVIIITGVDGSEDEDLYRKGAKAILRKPFNGEELDRLIQENTSF